MSKQPTIDVPDLWPDLPESFPITVVTARKIRSRSQLNRDIAAGRLPAYKMGSKIWVRKSDLLAMLTRVRSA